MTIWVMTRRDFLKAGATAGAGLTLAFHLPGCTGTGSPAAPQSFAPNAWLRIGTDESVTIMVDRSEMGQGVTTALPMILADELDADWNRVKVESAPAGSEYANPAFGPLKLQATGGSTSVRAALGPLRTAAAKARQMLVNAAAAKWDVKPARCRTANGHVIHPNGTNHLTYGEVALRAAALPIPEQVVLKDPANFNLIGKPIRRLDVPDKVTGKAVFGIDVRLPGMLTAAVVRAPVFGGRVLKVDDTAAKALPGVKQVVQIGSGVAVVADNYWNARQGCQVLAITWDEGPHRGLDSGEISRKLRSLGQSPGAVARHEGSGVDGLRTAARKVEAVYQVPYLAHATMEPMNCTADVRPERCTVWAPTQFQSGTALGVRGVAAELTGLPESAVEVRTTYLGGGFGRRFELDFVLEAVELSKAVGAPVKVIWSREDDMRHDFYRPATWNRLQGGLDRGGQLVAWTHRIVAPSIISRFPSLFGPLKDGLDFTATEGAANLAYAIPNLHVDYVPADVGVPVGFWRSVGNSQNAFIVESFIDEMAGAAGKDPFEFRRALLAQAPRHRAVLELAAAKAGWGGALPAGRARGIAVHESFGSWVAEVAEVSVVGGQVKVHRVTCAVDCGMVINPDIVAAQMEGAIVYGLSAALHGAITIKNGRVEQGHFADYPVLRMNEMPEVEVHLVTSTEAPGGAGEPGTPPIAPAVTNAIFAATGKRVRSLPIRL